MIDTLGTLIDMFDRIEAIRSRAASSGLHERKHYEDMAVIIKRLDYAKLELINRMMKIEVDKDDHNLYRS